MLCSHRREALIPSLDHGSPAGPTSPWAFSSLRRAGGLSLPPIAPRLSQGLACKAEGVLAGCAHYYLLANLQVASSDPRRINPGAGEGQPLQATAFATCKPPDTRQIAGGNATLTLCEEPRFVHRDAKPTEKGRTRTGTAGGLRGCRVLLA